MDYLERFRKFAEALRRFADEVPSRFDCGIDSNNFGTTFETVIRRYRRTFTSSPNEHRSFGP